MPRLFRPFAALIAAAAIAVIGTSSVLAAAEPTNIKIDQSFCYSIGSTQYCYEIDGTLRYLDTSAGSSVTVNKVTKTSKYEAGEYVGGALSAVTSRQVFEADGTVVIQSMTHTRSTMGDEPCTYRLLMRLVDYDAVVFETESTCTA